MKKIYLYLGLIACLSYAFAAGEPGMLSYPQNTFSGYIDEMYPTDIGPTNAADCLNIYLDEYTGAITKRKGSVKDNSTLLPGNLWVRNMIDYTKIDGSDYRVLQTSGSVLLTQDGSYTSIITGLDSVSRCDMTVAKDWVYGANGYTVFKSSGYAATTLSVLNSTGIPTTAKYIKYLNNRMFFAGMPATPSQVWFSESDDPDNVQNFNYILINVSDGDYITGISGFQGQIIVTKRYSTWSLIEVNPGVFQVSPISLNIGCLYESTMQTYKNYPVWLSHRGVELYDGQFNLISKPINNTILPLRQMLSAQYLSAQYLWTQSIATDWGAGTGINIDTTTTPGIVIPSYSSLFTTPAYSIAQSSPGFVDNSLSTIGFSVYRSRQKFVTTTTVTVSSFTFNMYRQAVGSGYYQVGIMDVNGIQLTYAEYPVLGVSLSTNTPILMSFPGVALSANSTYYMTVSSGTSFYVASDAVQHNFGVVMHDADSYAGAQVDSYASSWGNYGNSQRFQFTMSLYNNTASYTTQYKLANSWVAWGGFTPIAINAPTDRGNSVKYYAVTSTSVYNLSTNASFPITAGGQISSSVGPYIKIISSFTVADATSLPYLSYTKVVWYGLSNMTPTSVIYKDRYYLSVSTDNNNGVNDIVLVYDYNGQWLKHGGNWGAACVYKQSLYTGSSVKGQVYQQDVPAIYSDDGAVYDSFYCTKMLDFKEQDPSLFVYEKVLNTLWVRTNSLATGTFDIDYRLDGRLGAWNKMATLSSYSPDGVNVQKCNFTGFPKSRCVQLRFRNSSSSDQMNINGFMLQLTLEPQR